MPFNKRSFFLATTAIELALLLGYGRSLYTGNCTDDINTTAAAAAAAAAAEAADPSLGDDDEEVLASLPPASGSCSTTP